MLPWLGSYFLPPCICRAAVRFQGLVHSQSWGLCRDREQGLRFLFLAPSKQPGTERRLRKFWSLSKEAAEIAHERPVEGGGGALSTVDLRLLFGLAMGFLLGKEVGGWELGCGSRMPWPGSPALPCESVLPCHLQQEHIYSQKGRHQASSRRCPVQAEGHIPDACL